MTEATGAWPSSQEMANSSRLCPCSWAKVASALGHLQPGLESGEALGRHTREATPRRRRLALLVLAGEEAGGQGEVGDEADALPLALGQDLRFGLPLEEAVLVLDADEAGGAVGHGRRRLPQLGGREVRAADLADLAGRDAVVEGPQGVGDGGVGIGGVEDVEVDACRCPGGGGCPPGRRRT